MLGNAVKGLGSSTGATAVVSASGGGAEDEEGSTVAGISAGVVIGGSDSGPGAESCAGWAETDSGIKVGSGS